jgi:hypothetical protein
MENKDIKKIAEKIDILEKKQEKILEKLDEIEKFNKEIINKNLHIIGNRLS